MESLENMIKCTRVDWFICAILKRLKFMKDQYHLKISNYFVVLIDKNLITNNTYNKNNE